MRRSAKIGAVLASSVLGVAALAQTAAPPADPLASWNVNHRGIDATATMQDCLACHESMGIHRDTSHPVDVDYAEAQGRSRGSLRPLADAVRRGVFLSDGRIHCLTCHDPRSPWAKHLALPPGARAQRAVRPGVESTYTEDAAPASPPAGSDVSPKPLCLLCHTYGD